VQNGSWRGADLAPGAAWDWHSNPPTTLSVYAQGVDENRLTAQGLMMNGVLKPVTEMIQ
jgi:hypothetical protein